MKKNEFIRIKNHILQIDLVLAECHYPILFTCVDEENNMYIVTCFNSDANGQDWLITNTSAGVVRDLLYNLIPIRAVFPIDNHVVYTAHLKNSSACPIVTETTISQIDPLFLPTDNIFMDAEEGEFEEELAVLTERMKR